MDSGITRMRKLSGIAMGLAWAAEAVLALSIFGSVWALVDLSAAVQMGADFWVSGFSSLLGIFGLGFLLAQAIRFLGALRKGDTPFVAGNVRRLKAMALTMGVLGVLQFATIAVLSLIQRGYFQMGPGWGSIGMIGGADGPTAVFVSTSNAPVGDYSFLVYLLLALVVYCVALAFEHGALLQQQSDETL